MLLLLRLRTLLLCSLCALPLPLVHAADETPRLETLIVTASRHQQPWLRSPGAASVIESEEQMPGLRIDSGELLQGFAGLQVDSRSNYAQDTRVVLRGFGARSAFGIRGMDIRLDNIPLAMPDGQAQLGSVLLSEVASVEVLRGPLAALYGNGAGGVVRLHTKVPQQNSVKLASSAGSFGSRRQELSGALQNGPWAVRAQASHLRSDGFRDHSEVERQQGGAQLYYRGDNGLEATLRLDVSRDPETEDPSGLSPADWREDPTQVTRRAIDFNTRKQLRHHQVSLNVAQQIAVGTLRIAAWQGQRDVAQWLPFTGDDITSSGAVIDLERDFSGLLVDFQHQGVVAGVPVMTTLGASLERMEDARRGYVNDLGQTGALRRDETGTVDSDDVFLLSEWQLTEELNLLGGVRHSRSDFTVDDAFIVPENPDDSGSLSFAETSLALGANYRLSENWALFGSVGRGFETPTLTEMAYQNDATGLNTDLIPSTNVQLEAGARFSANDTLRWSLTAFRVDSDDELVVDRSTGGRTTYHNAAATQRDGLEWEGDWDLSPTVNVRGSATWLDATYTAGPWSGNTLPGVAREQSYLQLRWRPATLESTSLRLAGRYRSSVATSDDNDVTAPSYVTFDAALTQQYRWGGMSIEAWIAVENIADKDYVGSVIVNQGSGRSFEPAPGRTATVGLALSI